MKSFEKLVLLPFERYEQLIKNKEKFGKENNNDFIKSEAEKEKKSDLTVFKTNSEKKSTPLQDTSEEKTITQSIIEENTDKNQKKENTPEKKISPLIKVPPRPPGIPNKPKKNKLKWEKLF